MRKIILYGLVWVWMAPLGVYAQSSDLVGNVTLGDGEPLDEVKVLINDTKAFYSDADGKFVASGLKKNVKPASLVAFKEGFELSTWNYLNGQVYVYMRTATIKFIHGSIKNAQGVPIVGKSLVYKGKSDERTLKTDDKGSFIFKLPFDETFNKAEFYLEGRPCAISNLSEDKETNIIRIALKEQDEDEVIYTVKVSSMSGKAMKDQLVQIDKQSYFTSKDGSFRVSSNDLSGAKWSFGGMEIESMDTDHAAQAISVVLKKPKPVQIDEPVAQRDTHAIISLEDTTVTITGELSHGIGHMHNFYEEQEAQLRAHNQTVNEIHDMLSQVTEFSKEDHQLLTTQLKQLVASIESTSRAFNETRDINMAFVLEMRNKLHEKEQTIQEKNQLITQIQDHMTLIITTLLGLTMLLMFALWTIRRFKAQNRVIERTKKELVKVQEMAKIGSMRYDSGSKTFDFSENFFRALNISNPERIRKLQGKSDGMIPNELVAVTDQPEVEEAWNKGLKGKEQMVSMEFQGNSETEEPLYIDMRTRFERNTLNQVTYISSSLQDVSEKKEQEINLRNALLEAEEAGKAKEQFLAAMSHEIRTPLNAIIGLTDQLIHAEPTDKQKKNLDIIQISSQHLLSLLNDVLDFSKIKAGKIRLENVNFNLIKEVKDTVKALSISAGSRGLALDTKIDKNLPDELIGDKLRVNQVLINLVSNAIKFTENGGVTVSIQLVEETSSKAEIRFAVKDTGVGISEDKLDKIFESFEQEDVSTTRKYGGTGLGLAICKQLVELLGGEIKVSSELGKGSEFSFNAKFEKSSNTASSAAELQSEEEKVKQIAGVRILCVEDNEINRMVVSQYFNAWKIDATYAETGEKAIELFGQKKFDLVFMDIRLPDMSGYQITERLLKDFPERKESIIAFTAELDNSTMDKIKDSGMVDFISKPFKTDQMIDKIIKYIS